MDLIKQFMKIGGAKTPEELLKMYPTEEAFFMKHGAAINKLLAKAQDGLWFQDPNKQALYDAETRYIEANQRGANYNADAAKAYGDILMMDPSATDIRQKVDSLNNVYPYYSSSFQQVPFKGGFGLYGNRYSNNGWEATQQLYDKEKQKPSMFPTDFSEPKWKGSVKKAMGGTPEAFPQIATFDKAFSYGVPPGPQYLSHGGSAYPQAQTEAQFFVPVYTDVYNPYNKEMGGSNIEMYPNAKVMPHWGPTNVWFQDGGAQQQDPQALVQQIAQALQKGMKPQQIAAELAKTGMPQEKAMQAVQMVMQEMQRMQMEQQQAPQEQPMPEQPMMEEGGTSKISTAGNKRLKYLTNTVKNTAEIAVQDKLTKNVTQQFKAGGLVKYQGSDPNQGSDVKIGSQSPFTGLTGEQMTDILNNWWKETNTKNQQLYGPGPQGPPAYYPPYGPGYNYYPQPYYYPQPQYDMRGLMPDLYAYSMRNSFPGANTKTKFFIDGQRAGKFYSNMPLIKAMYPELYGRGNFEDLMKNNADFRNRADAMGLSSYEEPTGLRRLFGKRKYTFNTSIPIKNSDLPSVKDPGPKPAAPPNTTSMSVNDLINMIDKMPSQVPGATAPAASSTTPGAPASASTPGAPAPPASGVPSASAPSSPASQAATPGQPAASAPSPGAAPGQPAAQPMPTPTTGVGPMRAEFMYPEDVQSEPQLGPYTPGSTRQTMLDPSTAATPPPATWNNPVASIMPPIPTGPTPQDYADFAGKSPYAPFSVSPDNYMNTYSGNLVEDLPGNVVPSPSVQAPVPPVIAPPAAPPTMPELPVGADSVYENFLLDETSPHIWRNENSNFATRLPTPNDPQFNNGLFDPMDWRNQIPYGQPSSKDSSSKDKYSPHAAAVFLGQDPNSQNFRDFLNQAEGDPDLETNPKEKARIQARHDILKKEAASKQKILKSYDGVPDPLKDIAADNLFNSGADPRVSLLFAAGATHPTETESVAGSKGTRPRYLNFNNKADRDYVKNNIDQLWNQNKSTINQQYNDDPQAFTRNASSYRDAYYQLINPIQGRYKDTRGNVIQTPGLQYPAWHGRTEGTQKYIDRKYFNPNLGYQAPEFFQKYGGLPKAQFGPQEFSNSPLLSPDVNSNQLVEVQGTSSFPNYNWDSGSNNPTFKDMVDIGKYEKPIEMDLESEPLSKKLRFDFLEGKNRGANYAFMPVQGVKEAVIAAGSSDGFQTRWMDMTDPALLAERRKEAMNPSQTLSKGLQAPNSNEMYGPFGQRSITLQDFYTPKGVRMASGGNVKQNDVVYWDEDTIREFIANGGQVEYLD